MKLILPVIVATLSLCWMLGFQSAPSVAAERLSGDEAAAGLERAVRFFSEEVSSHGGFLWRYSADLKQQEGETAAKASTAWVQPPGTPAVGMALLEAYQLMGDQYLLDAARETGFALVKGQLQSGGWDYRIEFAPPERERYAYRVENRTKADNNVTTLDDNTTQSALTFLMLLDEELQFKDGRIHEAVEYALASLLKAQYPNGAWPQRYSDFPEPDKFPVIQASYPESWPRKHPDENYRGYYTLNDRVLSDMIDAMLLAADIYHESRYRRAAERAGDFFLLAQMPEPQPAWAQQYNLQMQPAWARRFEPPSITGGESQSAIQTLLHLYRRTGNENYLRPLPQALDYLKNSELPDGRLARFYELQTNRPLYFTKQYELTYSDDDLPTHYGFIVSSKVDRLKQQYQRLLKAGPRSSTEERRPEAPRWSEALERQAREALQEMDERGAWVTRGSLRTADEPSANSQIIESSTFSERIRDLARYVAAQRIMENSKGQEK